MNSSKKFSLRNVLFLPRDSKLRLIEILLIVGSLMSILKAPEVLSWPLLLAVIFSVVYFIMLHRTKRNKTAKVFTNSFAALVAFAFSYVLSGILFGMLNTQWTNAFGIVLVPFGYFIFLFMLILIALWD